MRLIDTISTLNFEFRFKSLNKKPYRLESFFGRVTLIVREIRKDQFKVALERRQIRPPDCLREACAEDASQRARLTNRFQQVVYTRRWLRKRIDFRLVFVFVRVSVRRIGNEGDRLCMRLSP